MAIFAALFLVVFELNVPPALSGPRSIACVDVEPDRLAQQSVTNDSPRQLGQRDASHGSCSTDHGKCNDVYVGNGKPGERQRHPRRWRKRRAFMAFALSPLPSKYLFIAYGLTSLPIMFLAVPFFVGRLLSYGFWVATASTVGDRLNVDWFESSAYLSAYFALSQLLLVPTIYAFTRVDWHAAFAERRLKLFDKTR